MAPRATASFVLLCALVGAGLLPPTSGSATTAAAQSPIAVELSGSGAGGMLTFSDTCESPIGPGSLCSEDLEVRNVSASAGADLRYEISAWSDADGIDAGGPGPADDSIDPCFTVGLEAGAADVAPGGPLAGPVPGGVLPPGDHDQWRLVATVAGDNDCQGESGFIVVTAAATSLDGRGRHHDSGSGPLGPARAGPVTPGQPVGSAPDATPAGPDDPDKDGTDSVEDLPATGHGWMEDVSREDPYLVAGILAFLAAFFLLLRRRRRSPEGER